MQERQGLSDKDICDMPYARFLAKVQSLSQRLNEESLEKLRLEAFSSWLVHPGNAKTFGDYLNYYKLGEPKKELTEEDKQKALQEVEENVQELFNMFEVAARESRKNAKEKAENT